MSVDQVASSLGQELKRLREARGLTLRQIEDETRIHIRFLQAIENDNYQILPSGIFARSFIRMFAKQVGMSEEEAVRWFDRQQRQTLGEDESVEIPPALIESTQLDESPQPRIGLIILVLVALGAVGFAGWKILPSLRSQFTDNREATQTPPQSATAPPPASATTQPTVSPNGPLNIYLKVTQESCWLRVKVDNQSSEDLLLTVGQERTWQPREKLEIWLGETKHIEMRINGCVAQFDKSVIQAAVITPETIQQCIANQPITGREVRPPPPRPRPTTPAPERPQERSTTTPSPSEG